VTIATKFRSRVRGAAKVQWEPKIASGDTLYKEMYPSISSGDLRDVVLEDIED
jgi:hypothetical protein